MCLKIGGNVNIRACLFGTLFWGKQHEVSDVLHFYWPISITSTTSTRDPFDAIEYVTVDCFN